MMKRVNFFLVMMFFVFGSQLLTNQTIVATAETVENEKIKTTKNVEEITFEELSDQDKKTFLNDGFTEEDVFFKNTIFVIPKSDNNTKNIVQPQMIASFVGSTRRTATNRARTTYTIQSYTTPMLRIDLQTTATSSETTRIETATSYPNAMSAVMTTDIVYNGPATLFTMKGYVQVRFAITGTAGTVFSITAGGTTLGY